MRKGFDKKIVLLAVWLALLGGLLFWINRSAPAAPSDAASSESSPS